MNTCTCFNRGKVYAGTYSTLQGTTNKLWRTVRGYNQTYIYFDTTLPQTNGGYANFIQMSFEPDLNGVNGSWPVMSGIPASLQV